MNRFKAPIKIRHTGATGADEPVWQMRLKDDSSRIVWVRRIFVVVAFDGTAAATTSSYVIERFDTATMTGGAAITAQPTVSGATATHITDIRDVVVGTGLTDTSVVNLQELVNIGCPRGATGGSVAFNLTDVCYLRNLGDVKQGEGLAITLDETSVIGDSLRGYVEWEEVEAGAS